MTDRIVSLNEVILISEQDGVLVVDSRLIADELGIQHESFMRRIRKHQDDIEAKLGAISFSDGKEDGKKRRGGRPEIFALLTQEQSDFLIAKARYSIGGRPQTRLTEASVTNRLKEAVGGVREVLTPAGNIDLLTSTEIIEVKTASAWKQAIGQILVYSYYYPSHSKRIHLFGSCHSKTLELIKQHCDSLGIRFTFEAKKLKQKEEASLRWFPSVVEQLI